MTRLTPVPVYILTGFLGAGKTSLLNGLLRQGLLPRSAVIVNEFGEIGLDRLFIERAGNEIVEMADGCLCCAWRGELGATLSALPKTGIDRVIIETTGLADPLPVLESLASHCAGYARHKISGIVTVVDAINADSTLDEHPEARSQVALADALVLGKRDLLDPATAEASLAALSSRLRGVNPHAPLVLREDTRRIGELLSGGGLLAAGFSAQNPLTAHNQGHWQGHSHDHSHGHKHGHGTDLHSGAIRSISIRHEPPMKMAALKAFFDLVASAHGNRILRMKALANFDGNPFAVHAVRGIAHDPEPLPGWLDGDRSTRIVAILRGMEPDFIYRLFAGFAGIPLSDTPDAAALLGNPLAVPGFGARGRR